MKKMMMFAALIAAGCAASTTTQQGPESDAGAAPVDSDDPDPGEPCNAGAFLGCSGNIAKRCAADGVTVTQETCEAGCNADAARCNECDPSTVTCADSALRACGPEGLIASTENCSLGCLAGEAPHCAHIVPEFLPSVCDVAASQPTLVIPGGQVNALDTNVAANCTGGIIAQPNGPEVCVVRYGTISIDGFLQVTGQRAVAFVADSTLEINNIVDVSATRRVSGPGGRRTSGAAASAAGGAGGGGAGGKQVGGNGGSAGELNDGQGTGGAIIDPLTTQLFEGGARAASVSGFNGNYRPTGGGGGGALMLISCTGEVQVAGTIEAGGGGGDGGGDGSASSEISLFGGAGGGAGGYVVMQGARVTVSGKLFANGGGGGGGCSTSNCVGVSGEDAAQIKARGGSGQGGGSAGGAGGFGATTAVTGSAGTPPGGGGGSVGRFQIFTPAGVAPTNTATSQPAFEPNKTVVVR